MLSLILIFILVIGIKYILEYFNKQKFPLLPKNGSILMTGCSPPQSVSIGYTVASALSLQGFQVFAGVMNDQEAQKLKQMQPSLVPIILDVTKDTDIENAYQSILKQTENRPLVALINNAGVWISDIIEYSSIQQFKNVMNVNAIGHVAVTIKFLPLIMKAKGRIVNVISVAGIISGARMSQYTMSKFAMEAFTDSLRREQFASGVSVSAIEPVFIKTDMVKNLKVQSYPDGAATRYPHLIISSEDQKKMIQNIYENALNVETVLEAIMHAINSETPKTRYLVADTIFHIIIFLSRILPDRIFDKLLILTSKKMKSMPK